VTERPLQMCSRCDEPTGRTTGEDSMYADDDIHGVDPLCEDCWACSESLEDMDGQAIDAEGFKS